LQRSLGIGYGRAARLVDFMAEDGIVGNYNGSQAREVAITLEQWEAMQAAGAAEAPAVAKAAPKKRSNKIAIEEEDRPALPPPKPRALKPVVEDITDEEDEEDEESLWEESSSDSESELDDERGEEDEFEEEEMEAESA
jgi:S-DNA-T family DNA segregation ATPase FtsK/SpoIIIE